MRSDNMVSRGAGRLDAGQAVVLCRGALAGLTGVLMRTTADRKCLIRLDDVPQGVLVMIDAAAVVKRRGQSIVLDE